MSAAAERPFSELTLAELRAKAAQLAERAAKLRGRQAVSVATTAGTVALGRAVRAAAQQAGEYALLVAFAEQRNTEMKRTER